MKSTILLIHYYFVARECGLEIGNGDGFASLELLYATDDEYRSSYLRKTQKLRQEVLENFCEGNPNIGQIESVNLTFVNFDCVHSKTKDWV